MGEATTVSFPTAVIRDDYIPKGRLFQPGLCTAGRREVFGPKYGRSLADSRKSPTAATMSPMTLSTIRSSSSALTMTRPFARFTMCARIAGDGLTEGCGHATQIACRFHGWRFDLEGKNIRIVDPDDWGDRLAAGDVDLKPVLRRQAGAARFGSTWTSTPSRWPIS